MRPGGSGTHTVDRVLSLLTEPLAHLSCCRMACTSACRLGAAKPAVFLGAKVLERLQALPGFDDEAVIRAMGCTDNELFEVWSCGG